MQALVTYLADHGVPKDQMLSVVVQNPVLRSAEARQTIWKAARVRRACRKLASRRRHEERTDRRCGPAFQTSHRASRPLWKNCVPRKGSLRSATGDRAARISAQIHGLQRQARRLKMVRRKSGLSYEGRDDLAKLGG